MKKEEVYVIGHKSPDTDTVCSSIACAALLRKKGINALPAVFGELNPETKYALEIFKFNDLKKIKSLKGKKVFLVDHNESIQSPDGIEEAEVIGIIDHHKINFSSKDPLSIEIKPYGSTATIIAEKMICEGFKITKQLAGLILCAIISDTVIFKSTTTTNNDIKIAKSLAKLAGIENMKKFGIELKKKKASLKNLSSKEIINSDLKLFENGEIKFYVGQVEVVDLLEARERKIEIIQSLNELLNEEVRMGILMITDIIKEGSELFVAGNEEFIEDALKVKIKDSSIYIPKMMSRKKDLVPKLMK